MGLNLTTDYKVFDEGDTSNQLLSVSYYSRTNTAGVGTFNLIPLTKAIKLDTTTRERYSSWGVYVQTIVDFDLRTQDFTLDTPAVGDYMVDDELLAYMVTSVRRPVFGDYWGISCVCPQLVGASTITHHIANEVTDEYGGRTITFVNGSTLLGWVQPTNNSVTDMFGKRGFIEDYNIWTITNLDVKYGDVIECLGVDYEIYDISKQRQIDELQYMKGVIKP